MSSQEYPVLQSIPALSEDLFEERDKLLKQINKLNEKIVARVNYIVRTIYSVFNLKLDIWDFSNAGEGGYGDFDKSNSSDTIYVDLKPYYHNLVILTKDKKEFNLSSEFPTRWLTEFFEDELVEGKQAYIDLVEFRKLRAKEKSEKVKLEEEKMMEKIKSKLTDKELNFIKRKL